MSVFDELILRGTAIADRSAGEGRGTAFRIAPRYAVTAGHVVDDGAGGVVSSVQLDFGNGKTCTARVVAHSAHPGLGPGGKPDEGFWTFPDLAVLELPEGVLPEVLCVLMTEIMPQQRELRGGGAWGYPSRSRCAYRSRAPPSRSRTTTGSCGSRTSSCAAATPAGRSSRPRPAP